MNYMVTCSNDQAGLGVPDLCRLLAVLARQVLAGGHHPHVDPGVDGDQQEQGDQAIHEQVQVGQVHLK